MLVLFLIILIIYIAILFNFSKLSKRSKENLPIVLSLSDMIPLDIVGKNVSSVFPESVSKSILPDQYYVWVSSTCNACEKSLKEACELLDHNNNIEKKLLILTTEPNTKYQKLHSKFEEVSLFEKISTYDMGEILYSTPCYFKVDANKKFSDISLNPNFQI
ncbi:hypothetical protein A0126_18930 (plasmid) [Exiguobacterium sp. N4-1P]|uniref:hypothetical protein n=1 Tax=Exiguobacterium sp. N4-1P TaxID=2051906 RepID=UPI000B588186|nr:hypothetical protein [Exiguobacterium sp. N4-1P]ASI36889.1 hypothetical protein A0126_15250 [Exiguobacterium sp. N4-1P]ASI37662.1 hypothetical protein A0126_18930 [Exiguobacterium sp. N4-1P]